MYTLGIEFVRQHRGNIAATFFSHGDRIRERGPAADPHGRMSLSIILLANNPPGDNCCSNNSLIHTGVSHIVLYNSSIIMKRTTFDRIIIILL